MDLIALAIILLIAAWLGKKTFTSSNQTVTFYSGMAVFLLLSIAAILVAERFYG